MRRILCVGETLIDFIAQTDVGDVGASEFFRRAAGGAVSNVAVGVARLGGDAAFAGAIGRDSFGTFLLRTLAHENVNVDATRLVDEITTLAFVARGADGQRDFVFARNPGADSALRPDDLDPTIASQARVVHFGGVLLASEPGRTTSLHAAELGRRAGALVSFDPNARPSLFSSALHMRETLRAACAAATLVKCSVEDLDAMGVQRDIPSLLFDGATEAVVVTDGPKQARWILKEGASGAAAPPRVKPVDTTGAGDAFMAALLARLLDKHELRLSAPALDDAARYACAAGAFACLSEGAIPSLPRAADVEAMLHD